MLPTEISLAQSKQSSDAAENESSSRSVLQESNIDNLINEIIQVVAPVWPLKDYVAVNPYMGFSGKEFLETREYLRTLSNVEMFMPVEYYRQQFHKGVIDRSSISAAVDDLVADGIEGAEQIDVNQVIAFLSEYPAFGPTADAEFTVAPNPHRALYSVLEHLDGSEKTRWQPTVNEEISKLCATHFDEGQATWKSATQAESLYQAWRSQQKYDRTIEVLGIRQFRKFCGTLPENPNIAVGFCLNRLAIPRALWKDYLLCLSLTLPGWSSWCRYQQWKADETGESCDDFAGLLAIRLAYEVAICEASQFLIDWGHIQERHQDNLSKLANREISELSRYALLRASEIAYRNRTIELIEGQSKAAAAQPIGAESKDSKLEDSSERRVRSLAQMVFCIDVRSERIRRHIEAASREVETFGFAGFFGLPIEFVELGEKSGQANVPVLITPSIKVKEQIEAADTNSTNTAAQRRGNLRLLKKTWRDFQSSVVSMFGFVETSGLFYGWNLLTRSLGLAKSKTSRFDGVGQADQARLAPTLCGLEEQGIGVKEQADIAESILKGIGIVDNFARLVVFCGHGSQVENNPLKAGLDCGACGGHSGEPNARFAARLLNQSSVQQELKMRGYPLLPDTHFVAALHNTTTDEIQFFDEHNVPGSHQGDLEDLREFTKVATEATKQERLPLLNGLSINDPKRRSMDWSEVRPEWGLAGNAAFIAAPRKLTQQLSLEGRSFLHSYDYRQDGEFAVLEQIMTAPMVVANWINMQYFASTADPIHFGSGNKTVHNVTGRFGVVSGNGGDLQTGLPWQSVHDGKNFVHHPLRLLVILAAPCEAIDSVLEKHGNVSELVVNGWLQLLAVDDEAAFRRRTADGWECVTSTELHRHQEVLSH